MKFIELIMAILTRWIQSRNNAPTITPSSRTPTPPPMPDITEHEGPTYHVSLYMSDGTAVSRSRFNDEYCVRTDGNVYVKDKGKWVRMPDVIGLSFYKKS